MDRRQVLLLFASASCPAIAGIESAGSPQNSNSLTAEGTQMEKVLGIGGLFFRSKDPTVLSRWYRDLLGIELTPTDYDSLPWQTEAGPTAFAPFPQDSDYFGSRAQMWMVNFRVRDLDKMTAQLRSKGVTVKIDSEVYPNGRFARLHDPEGNPIELWEPKMPGAKPQQP